MFYKVILLFAGAKVAFAYKINLIVLLTGSI